MKKLLALVSALVMLGIVPSAFAYDIRVGSRRSTASGGLVSATNSTVAYGNCRITGVMVTSTSAGQVVGIYDASDLSSSATTGVTLGNLIMEVIAPANDSKYLDFSQSPIECSNGVTVIATSSTTASVSVEKTQ